MGFYEKDLLMPQFKNRRSFFGIETLSRTTLQNYIEYLNKYLVWCCVGVVIKKTVRLSPMACAKY